MTVSSQRCQWLAALGLAAAVATAQEPAAPASFLRDATAEAGIRFEQISAPEKKYILESMAGGVALLDHDGDGHRDIYFVNSLTVETADQPASARSAQSWTGGVTSSVGKSTDSATP